MIKKFLLQYFTALILNTSVILLFYNAFHGNFNFITSLIGVFILSFLSANCMNYIKNKQLISEIIEPFEEIEYNLKFMEKYMENDEIEDSYYYSVKESLSYIDEINNILKRSK